MPPIFSGKEALWQAVIDLAFAALTRCSAHQARPLVPVEQRAEALVAIYLILQRTITAG